MMAQSDRIGRRWCQWIIQLETCRQDVVRVANQREIEGWTEAEEARRRRLLAVAQDIRDVIGDLREIGEEL